MLNCGNYNAPKDIEKTMPKNRDWLGLMIGNSRLHWAYFQEERLQETWETPHLSLKTGESAIPEPLTHTQGALYLASVVPEQTELWLTQIPTAQKLTLTHIPLKGCYPNLGIDRALAVLGAGEQYGFPVLVIDGGTALTLTGADPQQTLIGGAILPGLRLQFQSLARRTAQLPDLTLPATLPPRWALATETAITSGVIYSVLGGVAGWIQNWQEQFPGSAIVLTGGDGALLGQYWAQSPLATVPITVDPHLIFWGIKAVRNRLIS
jgi:type III pantothenate kinase